MWQSLQIFWIKKTFFKKLEYRFLIENTKIENASEPNVKAKRMGSTKWTYHEEQINK